MRAGTGTFPAPCSDHASDRHLQGAADVFFSGFRFLLGQLPWFFGDMTSHVTSSILC